MRWYVVHTRVNAENAALHHLRRQAYDAYLPLCRRWRRHARRRELVLRPLFPRYMFVVLDPATMQWRPILSTIGVSGLVQHGDGPTPVPEGVVEELREREQAGAFDVTRAAPRLRVGDAVQVVRGPFSELVGSFAGMAEKDRVFVLLDLMGRSTRTAVDAAAVAPVGRT